MKLIVILKFLILIESYIIFDQGQNEQFNYETGFGCTQTNTTITTVTFSGTFEIPPQLLIIPRMVSVPNNPSRTFQYDIMFITTDGFQIKISCQIYGVIRYQFKWYAINDNRIKILQIPSEINCVDQSIYTHSHNLQLAKQAIVILQSWGMLTQPLNFYLEIYQVTSTNVKIKLHNFNSNLIQIGYQVVLGTQEAFLKSELIETLGGQYTLLRKSLIKLNKGILFLPLAGFDWSDNNNIRIGLNSQQNSNDIQYTCQTFDTTYMNSIRFQELWFFEQILFPMYVYSYRVTNKYERFIPHPIKVSIIELNSEYYNIGDFQVQIPNTMTTLIIQIELKFYKGEKLIGSFLKCNECGSKNVFKIDQNYLGGYNFIKYRLLLRQYSIDVQNLKISIGLSSVSIKQIINQVVQDYQIAQLQFISLNP